MKILIQRVKNASIKIDNKIYSQISAGMLVFLGITHTDTSKSADYLAQKLVGLRIFEDENGKINKSIAEINGEILLVSQFSLYANCDKGRRPGFDLAAPPQIAEPLYEYMTKKLNTLYPNKIKTGKFGANMQISLINDGPLTFALESP
jgi:D-tyrosyl-tRNA(Tyr) deacylase